MRKILFVMIPFIILGCTKNYEMSSGVTVVYTVKDFFDYDLIAKNIDDSEIICDRNTGILYYVESSLYRYGITPIIGENGKPLTLDEWKRKQIEKNKAEAEK